MINYALESENMPLNKLGNDEKEKAQARVILIVHVQAKHCVSKKIEMMCIYNPYICCHYVWC